MEGKCQRIGTRIRVHREFECSRIEQAMLAAAYRRIIPNDRLKLVERTNNTIDHRDGQPVLHDDDNLSHQYATAMGGPS
jgi:hypothetical protein